MKEDNILKYVILAICIIIGVLTGPLVSAFFVRSQISEDIILCLIIISVLELFLFVCFFWNRTEDSLKLFKSLADIMWNFWAIVGFSKYFLDLVSSSQTKEVVMRGMYSNIFISSALISLLLVAIMRFSITMRETRYNYIRYRNQNEASKK
jgi:hypothetical protein